MAVTDPYAVAAEYRAAIQKSDAGNDTAILSDLTAISRYLDKQLGRHFTVDAAPVARVYVSPRSASPTQRINWAESENPWRAGGLARVLTIDDLAALTSILIDEQRTGSFAGLTALASTDYELLPRNAALGSEPRPYTAIELTEWGTRFAWTPGARVQVTGTWGWPAVPGPIKSACIQLTAILRLESARATTIVDDLGRALGTSRMAQNIVSDLMSSYRRESY